MAQPNVAREPSMEEILASIRRIIESNEPASGDAFSATLPPVYDEEEEVASSFSAELVSPPAHVPPAANQGYGARQPHELSIATRDETASADGSEKTMSLADVAARVRAAADRNAALGPQGLAAQRLVETPSAPQPAVQQERPPQAQRPNDLRPLLNVAPPAPVRQPQPTQVTAPPVATLQTRPLPGWEGLELRGAVEPEQPTPVQMQPEILEAQPERVVEQPIKQAPQVNQSESNLSLNLISAAAGAQIAQSFGELAEMFDGVERPTVEQMAQDMLRPMLQDWLEDNLPTLVERLVREEIERVARGPRR